MKMVEHTVSDLVGRTLMRVTVSEDKERVTFTLDSGREYAMSHTQNCCESVQLEEVIGDLDDLVGAPILAAEESTNSEEPKPHEYSDSFTWTFYKLATIKGSVTLRWLGESNGYYSESVDFVEIT